MNAPYDSIFALLKNAEKNQPDGRYNFTFTAHGKGNQFHFKFTNGLQREAGGLKFKAFQGEAEAAEFLDGKNVRPMMQRVIGEIKEKFPAETYKPACLRTLDNLLAGMEHQVILSESVTAATKYVPGHNIPSDVIYLHGVWLGNNMTPVGVVDIEIHMVKMTDYEKRFNNLKANMDDARLKAAQLREDGVITV